MSQLALAEKEKMRSGIVDEFLKNTLNDALPMEGFLCDERWEVKLRRLTMSFAALNRLIDAAYFEIAASFSVHDVNSALEDAGIPSLSIILTIEECRPR